MNYGRDEKFVQKIQQITILKNSKSLSKYFGGFKKYNKLQSLRTYRGSLFADVRSKNTTNYNP